MAPPGISAPLARPHTLPDSHWWPCRETTCVSLLLALPSLLGLLRAPQVAPTSILILLPHPHHKGTPRSESQIFPQLNPSFSSLSETVTFYHHLWTCVRHLFTPWGTAWPIPFLVYQTCADRLLFPKARGHPDAYWPSNSTCQCLCGALSAF